MWDLILIDSVIFEETMLAIVDGWRRHVINTLTYEIALSEELKYHFTSCILIYYKLPVKLNRNCRNSNSEQS